MIVTLSTDLKKQMERELTAGRFERPDELIEHALRDFLERSEQSRHRLRDNPADLYEQVLSPDAE